MATKQDPGVALSILVRDALLGDASEFCQQFTCVRGHDPLDEAKLATTTPRLIVMPGVRRRESLTRSNKLRTISIWVAIVCKLAPGQGTRTEDKDDLTQVDELSAFATQVEEYFVPNDESKGVVYLEDDHNSFDAVESEIDPDFYSEQITRGVFASLIRVDFEQTIK